MATLTTTTLFPSAIDRDTVVSADADIEPDVEWKNQTRRQVEINLRSLVDKARADREAKLKESSELAIQQDVMNEYNERMAEICLMAEGQYRALLLNERRARKFAAGNLTQEEMGEWARQQQELLEDIHREAAGRQRSGSNASGAVADEIAGETTSEAMSRDHREHPRLDRSRTTFQERQSQPPSDIPESYHSSRSPTTTRGAQPVSGITAALRAAGTHTPPQSATISDAELGGVSRKHSSVSLSQARPAAEFWHPSSSPNDKPRASRTFIHATSETSGLNGSDGYPGDSPRGPSRTGSIRMDSRHSQSREPAYSIDLDATASLHRERVETDTIEEQYAPIARPREKQRETQDPQPRRQRSSSDHQSRRAEGRPPPSISSGWSQHARPVDSNTASQTRTTPSEEHFPSPVDRPGIPIRSSSRSSTSSYYQGSPETTRYQPSGLGSTRPLVSKLSNDGDFSQGQSSPSSRAFYAPQGTQAIPIASPGRRVVNKRSFTTDDARQLQSSPSARAWSGSESLPRIGRRDSIGSRSVRSQSSKQDFQVWHAVGRLSPYDEQSVSDLNEYDSDWEDAGYGLGLLEDLAEERRLIDEEARRVAAEAKRKQQEARRKEEELNRKEAETKRREEEVKRREQELERQTELTKRQAEDVKRQREETTRREQEAKRIEKQAQLHAEEAKRRLEEALLQTESAQRQGEEVKRRVEGARLLEEAVQRKQAELEKKQEELRLREREVEREEARLRSQEEELCRREQISREEEQARQRARREEDRRRQAERQREEDRRREEERQQAEDKRREEERRLEEERVQQEELEQKERERQAEARRQDEIRQQEELRKQGELRKQEAARQRAERRRGEILQQEVLQQEALRQEVRQQEALRQDASRGEAVRPEAEPVAAEGVASRIHDAELQHPENQEPVVQDALNLNDPDLIREQEALFRMYAQRNRQDSNASDYQSRSSASPHSSSSSAAPTAPWNIPGRSGSTSSSAGDRSSTTSSSSFTSSPSFSFSTRSGASTYTQTSTATGTTSTTPTKPAAGGWKSTPAAGAASSKKPPASPAPASFTPQEEEEWKRRQKEHARRQQEQFQRMQEQAEQDRLAKTTKQMTKEEVMQLFDEHERRWARLTSMDYLTWNSFPWPVLRPPKEPDDLTVYAIDAYVLSPHNPKDAGKSSKDRIKEHIRRWHPDRFETKLLCKVRDDEREKVKQGAGLVARNLNELLTRQSRANNDFIS